MTYITITEHIASIDRSIMSVSYKLSLLDKKRSALGDELIVLCKEKWHLEAQLVSIKQLPPQTAKGDQKPHRRGSIYLTTEQLDELTGIVE